MKPARRQRSAPGLEIDGPAVITPLHVLGRPATDADMRPITGTAAWRKLTPLEKCFWQDQLRGGNPKYDEHVRFQAGKKYAKLFNITESGGRDSTQALNVCQSNTMGANNDAQERAWDARLAIESHLTFADRRIVQMVCGDDSSLIDAVRAACYGYNRSVSERFREALDNLIDAMETARRRPGEIDMRRRA